MRVFWFYWFWLSAQHFCKKDSVANQNACAEMLPVGHKRKRVQTKLFGDDFVREDLRPGKGARRRKVMEPGGPDEAQGADALLSLAALAEEAESDTQSADEGALPQSHELSAPVLCTCGTCNKGAASLFLLVVFCQVVHV